MPLLAEQFFICKNGQQSLFILCDLFAQQQCDQIGRFLKSLVDKLSYKVAQMFGDFLGYIEKPNF